MFENESLLGDQFATLTLFGWIKPHLWERPCRVHHESSATGKTIETSTWVLFQLVQSLQGYKNLITEQLWGSPGGFHILITVHVFKERSLGVLCKVAKNDSTSTGVEAKAWMIWPPEVHLNQVLSFSRKQFILKSSPRQSLLLISVHHCFFILYCTFEFS